MTMARSFQYKVALKKETVWGTPVVPDVTFPIMDGSGVPQLTATYDDGKRGVATADFDALLDAGHGEMSFEGWYYPETIAHAIMGLFGTDTISGASDPYTHTFSLNVDVPSYTIEETYLAGASGGVQYAGSRFGSLSFNWDASGGALGYNATAMGKIPTVVTPAAPAISIETAFEGWQATVTSTGLTTPCVVTQGEINLTRDLQVIHTGCDSKDPSFINAGAMSVEGSLQVAFNNMALFNLFLAGTRQSLVISFVKGTPERSIVFTMTDCFFGAAPPEWDRSGISVLMRLSFRGIYNLTDAGNIKIVCKNAKATAY
jgi:hypothetical protein